MLKLHEHLKEEEDFTENMVNNSVQKRKVAFRTPSQLPIYLHMTHTVNKKMQLLYINFL